MRYPVRLSGLCRAAEVDNTSTWFAQIENISHEGLKIVCRRPVEVGTKILISPSDVSVLPRVARGVHVTCGSEGTWILGCEFTRELLDEAELLSWIRSQNGKHPRDRAS